MKREQIIIVLVIVVVVAVFGAGYQFYFKARAEEYSQHIAQREQLKSRLEELNTTFGGIRPTVLISRWRGAIQPWADALDQRAQFFSMDEITVEPVPEGKIAKFYYAQEFQKHVDALRKYAFDRNPPCQLPADLFKYFGAPLPSSFATTSVKPEEVVAALEQFEQGATLLKVFIDAKASAITAFNIWPVRKEYNDLVELHTVGAAFTIQPRDLTDFLIKLQRSDRYFNVNALSVQNPYIAAWWGEPPFQIQMLLTQAQFAQPKKSQAGEAAAGTAGATQSSPSGGTQGRTLEELFRERYGTRQQAAPESGFKRWWRDFRKHYLF